MNTRIRFKTVLTFAIVAMAIIGLVTTTASAAELTHDTAVRIYDNSAPSGNYKLSVFPGKAMYSAFGGNVTGTFGDGKVLDYRFFNTSDDVMGTYAHGEAGIIAYVTPPSSDTTHGNDSFAEVWTTNDPNADFLGDPANYIADTQARAQGFTGTIDISGLRSGTVYLIYGTYEDYNAISLTMSGDGQPDLTADHWENPSGTNCVWISSIDFSNDADLYDTISYTYVNNDFDASRARFAGVIIDGIGAFGPKDMTPQNYSLIAPGDVVLSWTNLDPCTPPTPTYVDVLFGTDPNELTLLPDATGLAVDTFTVPDPGLGTFFWQVNSYTEGLAGDVTVGPVLSFVNDAVITSVDQADKITWSGEGVQMAPAVVDDDASDLTYLWTAEPVIGVSVVFDPAVNPDDPNSSNVEAPIVTLTKETDFIPYVINGGFENPAMDDEANANTGSVPGWSTMWSAVGSGTWLPDASPDCGAANPLGDVAPEGVNVGHSQIDPGFINSLYQTVADVVEANTTYELSVKVGNTSGAATADYIVELVTGDMPAMGDGSATIEATATGASPADDTTWTTVEISFTTGDEVEDDSVGQPLTIRLSADNFGSTTTVSFDEVKLMINGEEGVIDYDDEMSTVTLTLTVTDETNPVVTDIITVDVYDTACKAALATGLSSEIDFNSDCVVNLEDFAVMAAAWLNDTSYIEAAPKYVEPEPEV